MKNSRQEKTEKRITMMVSSAMPPDIEKLSEIIKSKLPPVNDTTKGKLDKKRKFQFVHAAGMLCGQSTLWNWILDYGRPCVLPIFVRGCDSCPVNSDCARVHDLRKMLQAYRDRQAPSSVQDSDVLTQLEDFMSANRDRLDQEKLLSEEAVREYKSSQDTWVTASEAVSMVGNAYCFHKIQQEGLLEGKRVGKHIYYRRDDVTAAAEVMQGEVDMAKQRLKEKSIDTIFEHDGVPVVTKRMARKMLDLEPPMLRYYIKRGKLETVDAEYDGLRLEAVTVGSINGLLKSWPRERQDEVNRKLREEFGAESPIVRRDSVPEPEETMEAEDAKPGTGENMDAVRKRISETLKSAKAYMEAKKKLPPGLFSGHVPTLQEDLDVAYNDLISGETKMDAEEAEFFLVLLVALSIEHMGLENREEKLVGKYEAYMKSKADEPRGLFSGTRKSVLSDLDMLFDRLETSGPDYMLCDLIAILLVAWLVDIES